MTEIGINLSRATYWSTEVKFVDIMKQSGKWLSQGNGQWDDEREIPVDEFGWPTSLKSDQIASTLLVNDIGGHYPAGEYTLIWDGDGIMKLSQDAELSTRTGENSVKVNVTPSNSGILFSILSTNPSDPIRNVRLIMPGHEETYIEQPFNPDFLNSMRGVTVVRPMDGAGVNTGEYHGWEGRVTTNHRRQGDAQGMALEYQVMLANELDCDLWYNSHHLVTDEDVRQEAEMIRALLNKNVIWEYTNEPFNSIFPCSSYMQEKGVEEGLAENKYTAGTKYYGKRCGQISRIIDSVQDTKIITVISAQAANHNAWHAETIVKACRDEYLLPDAVAIAPYAGGTLGKNPEAENWTLDDVFDNLNKDLEKCATWVKAHKNVCDKYGIHLVAYEAGQHLVGYSDKVTELFIAANRDERMYQFYLDYIKMWEDNGGELMCLFTLCASSSKHGSWGLFEYLNQALTDAPKAKAFIEMIQPREEEKEDFTEELKQIAERLLYISERL